MKLLVVMSLISFSLFGLAEVANCLKTKPKQNFVILLSEKLTESQKNQTIAYLGNLGLSIVDSFDSTYLVKATKPSKLTVTEETKILKGLEVLVGKQIDAVGCEGTAEMPPTRGLPL
jgi:hypothetical protein